MEKSFYQEVKILVVVTALITSSHSVQIRRLSVPRWIQNGTEESVVLDCEYHLSERDTHFVLKWFLNDDPEPIYQWIPELGARHASRRISSRLNWDYTVSPSNFYTKYRALNIIRPTTDLSGRYACYTVSLESQDTLAKDMIVYATPKRFEFNFTKPAPDVTNFTCEANGVYPPPVMVLYKSTPSERESIHSSGTDFMTMTSKHQGAYNIKMYTIVRDIDLSYDGPTIFECVLMIPGTDFEAQKTIYYPALDDGSKSSRNIGIKNEGIIKSFCPYYKYLTHYKRK